MSPDEVADERTSTYPVIKVRRFAVVEFDGGGRRVRRVVTMFGTAVAAELFAIELGWDDFAVGPASIVVGLRE